VMGGLSGGLIVEGVLDPFPQLAGVKERVMLLKDIPITPQGTVPDNIDPSAPSFRTVNGLTNPTVVIAPGETQFPRIANVGADLYYREAQASRPKRRLRRQDMAVRLTRTHGYLQTDSGQRLAASASATAATEASATRSNLRRGSSRRGPSGP
jgi:hypothetical protein